MSFLSSIYCLHEIHEGCIGEFIYLTKVNLNTIVECHDDYWLLHHYVAPLKFFRIVHLDRDDHLLSFFGESVVLELLFQDLIEVVDFNPCHFIQVIHDWFALRVKHFVFLIPVTVVAC